MEGMHTRAPTMKKNQEHHLAYTEPKLATKSREEGK